VLAGEAFDKAARLLGLELSPNGGTALEKLAKEGDPERFKFSVPLKKYRDCNFSFAGTKTAVRLAIEDQLPEGPTESNRQVNY
jgi:N6-L-threonylcarbamoyladenine synthase